MGSMRYRDYKNFYRGGYFHVYNRGNNKQPIFLEESDYEQFLKRLSLVLQLPMTRGTLGKRIRLRPLPVKTFSILAYCLMPNHFHILVRQNSLVPVSKLIAKVCTSYSMYFNKKYKRVGTLFQGEFKSKTVLDDVYVQHLSAYILNNPTDPENYNFSSFREYFDLASVDNITDTRVILEMFGQNQQRYLDFVRRAHKNFDIDIAKGSPWQLGKLVRIVV